MNTPVLELVGVSRTLGEGARHVAALTEISLVVEVGELVAVMGPSGSGKSTLLGLAGALDTPTKGVVSVDGTPLAGLSTTARATLLRDHVGFVFQSYNLIPTLTAAENVSLPLELAGASARAAVESALKALRDGADAARGHHAIPTQTDVGAVDPMDSIPNPTALAEVARTTGEIDLTSVLGLIEALPREDSARLLTTSSPNSPRHAPKPEHSNRQTTTCTPRHLGKRARRAHLCLFECPDSADRLTQIRGNQAPRRT